MIDRTARKGCPDWSMATEALCVADGRLRPLVERVGLCTLAPRRDHFATLCHSIVSQQISTKAAFTVWARLRARFPRGRVEPSGLLAMSDAAWAEVGIGPQKRGYLRSLAEAKADGTIPTGGWGKLSDDEVIERLTKVRGVGRWTAEMFLLFALARPDVFPVDDFGLQSAAAKLLGRDGRLRGAELVALGERWRPWRGIATWYLWRAAPSFPQ